mgnify:CR=1 FL=1|jgi:O-antigen/teichoic acid export membrane protein
MKSRIKSIIEKGFFHIFGANVLNKIIQFANGIILVRLLTKEQFGLFSYAQNILMLFLLFNGLGVNSGMLQFGSETEDINKKNTFFHYGIKIGFTFNIFISIIILLFTTMFTLKVDDARPILKLMFLLPLFMFVLETIQIYLRSSLENKKFALLSNLNTFALFLCNVTGAYYFKVIGVVIFQYVAFGISIIIGLYLIKNSIIGILKASELDSSLKKDFLKFSLIQLFNNAISQMLYIIDIFIIGIIIVDETVIASYKTATLIPFALNFIPMSIMTFIYPYFAKNNKNKYWIKTNYLKLMKYLFVGNLFLSLFLILFAPLIITTLFGEQYSDAVVPFQILSIGYFIAATFRIPAGNILVMLREVKFGLYLSIITGVLNIILDIILIKFYGPIGAALATVSVFIFTSVIGVTYLLMKLKKNNKDEIL